MTENVNGSHDHDTTVLLEIEIEFNWQDEFSSFCCLGLITKPCQRPLLSKASFIAALYRR